MGFTTLYTYYVYFHEFLPSNSICFLQISNMVGLVEYESVAFSSILLYPVFLWWSVLVWHTDTFVIMQANFVKISLRQCSLSASIRHAYWHLFVSQKSTGHITEMIQHILDLHCQVQSLSAILRQYL